MKYIKQFSIILLISFLGEALHALLPLPIPASIYGIVLLFAALVLKIIPVSAVKDVSTFLLEIMPMLFIPAAAGLLEAWGILKPNLAAYIVITLVATVAVISKPPVGEAVSSLAQLGNLGNKDLLLALTTLLGGSCGGYIAFSGAHRLLDAGISGPENISHVRRSVLQGCGTSGLVRILLFLAVLGTCAMASGNAATIIAAGNPAAEAFRLAAGNIGYRLFGLCLFSAGVSSVVGAAYTSVSFLKTLHPFIAKYERQFVIGFITFSTVMMVVLGNAAALLIIAGAFNGLILPVTLGVMLIAGHNKRIVGESYHHPLWMTVLGAVVTLVALYAGIKAVPGIMQLFQ